MEELIVNNYLDNNISKKKVQTNIIDQNVLSDELKSKLSSKYINPNFKIKISSIITNFSKNNKKTSNEVDENINSFICIFINKLNNIHKRKTFNIKKNDILSYLDSPLNSPKNDKKMNSIYMSNINILKNNNSSCELKNNKKVNFSEKIKNNANLSQPHFCSKRESKDISLNNNENFSKDIIMKKNIIKYRNPSTILKKKKTNFSQNSSTNIVDNIKKIKMEFGLYYFIFFIILYNTQFSLFLIKY